MRNKTPSEVIEAQGLHPALARLELAAGELPPACPGAVAAPCGKKTAGTDNSAGHYFYLFHYQAFFIFME